MRAFVNKRALIMAACGRLFGIIDSERNVTLCSVATSSFGPRPLRWKASYWPARFG
jgi:hypothetical protein